MTTQSLERRSRGASSGVTSLFLLAAGFLALAALSCDSPSSPERDPGVFVVERVVDGDTVRLEELGSVRLIGIDCPETVHPTEPVGCFGPEASAKTTRELPPDERVRLELGLEDEDRFGRKLRYVFRLRDGYDVNLRLVAEGFCEAETRFPHPRMEEFVSAEESARDARLGLWGACP